MHSHGAAAALFFRTVAVGSPLVGTRFRTQQGQDYLALEERSAVSAHGSIAFNVAVGSHDHCLAVCGMAGAFRCMRHALKLSSG